MTTGGGAAEGRRAAELVVACLEAEGVRAVFGIPGEQALTGRRRPAQVDSSIR